MIDLTKLRAQLELGEGRRQKMYVDSVGKHTIGVGHNLDEKPISQRAIDAILDDDIADATHDCERLPCWIVVKDDDARARVLIDMCFNLGLGGLQRFVKMLAAVDAREWDTAADEMLASHWAQQVGQRAVTLARMMRTGRE